MSNDLRNFFFKPKNTFKRKSREEESSPSDEAPKNSKKKMTSRARPKIVSSDEEIEIKEAVNATEKSKRTTRSATSSSQHLSSDTMKEEKKVPITPSSYFANTSFSKAKRSSSISLKPTPNVLKEHPKQPLQIAVEIPPSKVSSPVKPKKRDIIDTSHSSKQKKPRVEVESADEVELVTIVSDNKSSFSKPITTPVEAPPTSSHAPKVHEQKTSVYFSKTRTPTDISTVPPKSVPTYPPQPQPPLSVSNPISALAPNETQNPNNILTELNAIEIPPVGAENCLGDLTFVQTGEFKRMERSQVGSLINQYGGRFTTAVSGKTNYLLIGDGFGEVKMKKAKELGIPTMDELTFYRFIQTQKSVTPAPVQPPAMHLLTSSQMNSTSAMWTDKYKPTKPSEIIGNKTLIERLEKWLMKFAQAQKDKFPFTGAQVGTHCRSVLLSGPPGIGKTTTAHVVAKHLGFHVLEFNASDVRNKSALDQILKVALHTRTLNEMMKPNKKPKDSAVNHCIIMDEVDGMSAGDRGGLAQLVVLLKKTEVPIICICNDRSDPKIRTLSNYCLDLRFRRPDASQIRSRLMTICYREQLEIEPQALDSLVSSTQSDIRQILHLLSQYKLSHSSISYYEAKVLGTGSVKDMTVGVFDSIRSLLSTVLQYEKFSKRFEHYFTDYDLMPLFMHENYIKCRPYANPGATLYKLSLAADAMCVGNHVDKLIHTEQNWGLMNVHSLFSTVAPASVCCGGVREMFQFPSVLGNTGKMGKCQRLLSSLHCHTGKRGIYYDRRSFRMDLIPVLVPLLLRLLKSEDFNGLIAILDHYFLSKTDMDELFELGLKPINEEALKAVPSTLKAKFTRAYNKTSHPVAVFELGIKKGQRVEESQVLGEDDEGEDEVASKGENSDDEENEEQLKMLLGSKDATGKASASSSSSGSSNSKRGKAAGSSTKKAPSRGRKKAD